MSALKTAVTDGLGQQGLAVIEDRGGLSVRDLDPELPVSIWVDENERVIRAEAPLCYPIDDYSPELSRALDYLNRVRGGVTFSYREANRALVVSSSWTSPTRSPSGSQLHLLMTLLLQAKDRDAPQLWRIAEGDATWDEVVDHEDVGRTSTQTLRFADSSGETTGGTGKFVRGAPAGAAAGSATEANRWSELMNLAEKSDEHPATKRWRDDSAAGGLGRGQPQSLDEMPTRKLDLQQARGRATPRAAGGDVGGEMGGMEPPKRLSRHALHVAVASKDKVQPGKDLTATYRRRRRGGGLLKFLLVFGLLAGVVLGINHYWVTIHGRGFIPNWDQVSGMIQDAAMSDAERMLKERNQIPPGKDLLIAELQDPLPGDAHELTLKRAIKATGAQTQEVLEGLILRSSNKDTRQRAFELWGEQGYADAEGAVLGLLKSLNTSKRFDEEDPVVTSLLAHLRSDPPTDAEAAAALGWARGAVWLALVETLGRPGKGAQERAKVLQGMLAKDTSEDKRALQALVKTGYAPKRAALDLIRANGVKWALEGAGKDLVLELAVKDVAYVEPLLGIDDADIQMAGVHLLQSCASRPAAQLLVRAMRTSTLQPAIRVAAVKALGDLKVPEAVWPLALELNRTSDEDEGQAKVTAEAARVLEHMPEADVVQQIEVHLAADKDLNERLWAVLALSKLETPAAVVALLEDGLRDPDERIRRRVLQTLTDQFASARTTLQRGLGTLRDVARNDSSAAVREQAQKLYQQLIGH